MAECEICHCEFEPWEDEDGDLEEDICFLCELDNRDQAEIDGLMGG